MKNFTQKIYWVTFLTLSCPSFSYARMVTQEPSSSGSNSCASTECPANSDLQHTSGLKYKGRWATLLSDKPLRESCNYTNGNSWMIFKQLKCGKMWETQIFGEYSKQGKNMPKRLEVDYALPHQQGSFHRDMALELDYIMVGTTAHAYLGQSRQLSCFLGPWLGMLLWVTPKIVQKGKIIPWMDGEEDKLILWYEKSLKMLNYGILAGIEYEHDSGIILGWDFNVGLRKISEDLNLGQYTFSTGVIVSCNFPRFFAYGE